MKPRQIKVTVGYLLLCVALYGCSFFTSTPTTAEQNAAIELAKAGSLQGCIALGRSLKTDERAKLGVSLSVVGTVLRQSSADDLATKLRAIDPAVAPYASAVAGLAFLELTRIPLQARDSALYQIIQGVVESCSAGIGMVARIGPSGEVPRCDDGVSDGE